ncbi:hypothetical protein GIB67_010294, partial [Kingdonia uniflora]
MGRVGFRSTTPLVPFNSKEWREGMEGNGWNIAAIFRPRKLAILTCFSLTATPSTVIPLNPRNKTKKGGWKCFESNSSISMLCPFPDLRQKEFRVKGNNPL